MRTATIVLVAYVAVRDRRGACWRLMPRRSRATRCPTIGALTAAYLGSPRAACRAPATAGSVVLGYLVDVISGTPPGSSCARARRDRLRRARDAAAHPRARRGDDDRRSRRSSRCSPASRAHRPRAVRRCRAPTVALELQQLALVALATALVGPLVWRAVPPDRRRVRAHASRARRRARGARAVMLTAFASADRQRPRAARAAPPAARGSRSS